MPVPALPSPFPGGPYRPCILDKPLPRHFSADNFGFFCVGAVRFPGCGRPARGMVGNRAVDVSGAPTIAPQELRGRDARAPGPSVPHVLTAGRAVPGPPSSKRRACIVPKTVRAHGGEGSRRPARAAIVQKRANAGNGHAGRVSPKSPAVGESAFETLPTVLLGPPFQGASATGLCVAGGKRPQTKANPHGRTAWKRPKNAITPSF